MTDDRFLAVVRRRLPYEAAIGWGPFPHNSNAANHDEAS